MEGRESWLGNVGHDPTVAHCNIQHSRLQRRSLDDKTWLCSHNIAWSIMVLQGVW